MLDWGNSYESVPENGRFPPTDGLNETFALTCPHCGVYTNAVIRAISYTEQNQLVKLPTPQMKIYNYFLECARCKNAILVQWPFERDPLNTQSFSVPWRVFPYPGDAFETRKLPAEAIPRAVLLDLQQAEISSVAGAREGAALLAQRACRALCADQGCDRDLPLKQQIRQLREKDLITRNLAELADGIPALDDAAAARPDPRAAAPVTSEAANALYRFCVQLVRAVYVDPAELKSLRESLAGKRKK